jgi:hypothetical protein
MKTKDFEVNGSKHSWNLICLNVADAVPPKQCNSHKFFNLFMANLCAMIPFFILATGIVSACAVSNMHANDGWLSTDNAATLECLWFVYYAEINAFYKSTRYETQDQSHPALMFSTEHVQRVHCNTHWLLACISHTLSFLCFEPESWLGKYHKVIIIYAFWDFVTV